MMPIFKKFSFFKKKSVNKSYLKIKMKNQILDFGFSFLIEGAWKPILLSQDRD